MVQALSPACRVFSQILSIASRGSTARSRNIIHSAGPLHFMSQSSVNRYPFYSPRFWHGMRPLTWFRLLRQGDFSISPSRMGLAVSVSLATPFNTLLLGLQNLVFRRRLRAAELHGPPVFIIGHWRSGTTLLHELMVRDERWSSPSTYQCFAPSHFLLTQWFFRTFAAWLLPGKRPMDNMATGWDRPQEDEFALVNLGAPSPYRRIAFPRRGPVDMDYLDFEGVDEQSRQQWLATLKSFLHRVSAATTRPLVIKSPTHTGRIGYLADAFPNARFIHITRDPRDLFPSTCRLWRSLDDVQSLQAPSAATSDDGIEEYVLDCFTRMYAAFNEQRHKIDDHHLIEIRYEDLIADPVATLENIYDSLRLADFETVREEIQTWTDNEHRSYQPNKHQLSVADEQRLQEHWGDYFSRYNY
ncbi:Sulfotransferase domain protein [Allorhodopirellula heiligendammensis]|uniref:Sulfotransferase domain protein n=2 Tax=Allorhodopirellula heiligendammensis TaxID=2714739 RepID=A0A5C6BWS1_9BACT|nr:Sulfotransferase domain protein [Allorhodopirellula heiligendammensis]